MSLHLKSSSCQKIYIYRRSKKIGSGVLHDALTELTVIRHKRKVQNFLPCKTHHQGRCDMGGSAGITYDDVLINHHPTRLPNHLNPDTNTLTPIEQCSNQSLPVPRNLRVVEKVGIETSKSALYRPSVSSFWNRRGDLIKRTRNLFYRQQEKILFIPNS
ncbi:uncharacterized protein TNCT_215771 [Trichonephila clavata]|uniref:Uncharacterized protein n=1 Tax=Trichonephila clavata TaxID=2740835 RepID=A0A8X6L1L1_TRICU|nr:uncharacterized protein TNCT_215771 [Trichonephila clavata]